MALSYEESLKKLLAADDDLEKQFEDAKAAAEENAKNLESDTATIASTPSLLSTYDDGYTYITNVYNKYNDYFDDKFSYIDKDTKLVTLDDTQINLTQETNSQFIPFEISRYYDGVDLTSMLIQIHYVNSDGNENYSTAVNVCYNSELIHFAWLVDNSVTYLAGKVAFEIVAIGSNEKGENYILKSRPNAALNIIESLSGNGIIEPDSDWYTAFVNLMDSKIAEAAAFASQASASAEEALSALDDLNGKIDNIVDEVMKDVEGSIASTLSDFYTKEEVDEIIANLDLSDIYEAIKNIDGLSKFDVTYDSASNTLTFYNGETIMKAIVLNTDPSIEWQEAYTATIENKISTAVTVVQSDLDSYKDTTDSDLASIHEAIDGLPETLQSDYYTKSDVDSMMSGKADQSDVTTLTNEVSNMKSSVDANSQSISDINGDISNLQAQIDNIGDIQVYEYEATYEDEIFTLWENGDIKNQFQITGGSGSGTAGSVITIERITPESAVVLSGDSVVIQFNFSSVDTSGDTTGNGTAVWRVGSTNVATSTVVQGENSFDITNYLKTGSNTIRLTITDSFGAVSAKTWTITVVEFKIESSFDDTLFYTGDVTFRFTPYGSISKEVVFVLDGKILGGMTTSVSGGQQTYTIPEQEHGSHLLEVYMTAIIDEREVQSNSIFKDIIWFDSTSTVPVIGCSIQNVEMRQYNTTNITYVVYDPQNNPASISLAVNGGTVSTLSVDRTAQVWSYKPTETGTMILTITCRDVVKTITVEVEELGIDISPVTTNLAIDFNPTGRTNNDTDRIWSDGTYTMSVSDNFDWSNGGYQIDDDGDTYFCVKAGTSAQFDYKLFASDAKRNGKEFKFVYKCTNVRNYDAQVLMCKDGNIGVEIYAQNASLSSAQNSMTVPYCEDSYMELEFNILPDSQYTEMVIWIDGIPCAVELYTASDSFTQSTPQNLIIGSDDCDVWVYRIKAYEMNLTDDEMLDNFIADAKNADEMIDRYTRNDILDSSGDLDPDVLAQQCPDLRIIKIDTPRFTTGKKDKVTTTSIQQIYVNGRDVDNWITYAPVLCGQGTSSEGYGDSSRNMDIDCQNGFEFDDGTTGDTYSMTSDSIGASYFNIKVNVASSENFNNAALVDDYNTFNPYTRPAKEADPRVRDTMEFHPCVVFIRETDIDNANEFYDGQWHFYSCGNFGNSKKNSQVFGMDESNPKEVIIEVDNNIDPQCRFLSDDLSDEDWSGDHSFEFRYENFTTDDEENAAKQAWQDLLTWMVNATPETFVAEFEDHFVKDSILYFYLFTERHLMVDNRAKNTFYHTEDLVHWDLCMDYDNDTAMGNDNEGGLTLTYGYEDVDTIGNRDVYNGADNKLFCYVRDYFNDDLNTLFVRLESQLAWSASRIITMFENEQALKPERLWVADMRRKYFRPYEDSGTTAYLPMMLGNKKHQRRQFQTYQEKYISSKRAGTVSTSDIITIRGYTPSSWVGVRPDATFHIVPYADMYVSARFGSDTPARIRAKRGETYDISSSGTMNDTEVYVYTASLVQSIGDIAPFYPGYTNFSYGIKLTDLTIGSGVEGYQNTNMSSFTIGKNVLLEYLDLQNLPNLVQGIELQDCVNLVTFLAGGSGITGVTFPTGGKITTAHLPGIRSMTGKNLYFLTDLEIESYENLETLSLDNCPTVDALEIVQNSPNLSRVRLTSIDWQIDSIDILDRLLEMKGIDENSYDINQSVLTGKVYVPVMKEHSLEEYNAAWPELEITYSSLIRQYTVTFVNDDGLDTVLDIQYVDAGETPTDPVTRTEDPIPTPTKESTVSTDYTFSGWDQTLGPIFSNTTIRAVYIESTRQYDVKYVNNMNNVVLYETTAEYGSSVFYEGDTPTYTGQEAAYTYYLFTGWDKSPYVDGDKTINTVFDSFSYTGSQFFEDHDLSELTPVQIYAIIQLNASVSNFDASDYVEMKDSLTIPLGHDYSYDDIEETEIIAEETVFNGSNYIDTGISVLEEDRSFVMAIDYKFDSGNSSGAVLAQCYQDNGQIGFKLSSTSSGLEYEWGSSNMKPSNADEREILVMRHVKGEYGVHVYVSNVSGSYITYQELTVSKAMETSSTLIFGAQKADDGYIENYAKGTVYWAKLWYVDLGDDACRELAAWPHESVNLEMCGFRRYYLSSDSTKRTTMSFLASEFLNRPMSLNSSVYNNRGGWPATSLNTFLNSRLVNAFGVQWAQLIKQVTLPCYEGSTSSGVASSEIIYTDCYIHLPALVEVDSTRDSDYGAEGTGISYLSTQSSRICYYPDGSTGAWYTRTPKSGSSSYWEGFDADGAPNEWMYPDEKRGIRIMLSI